jgi:hypothetical protein
LTQPYAPFSGRRGFAFVLRRSLLAAVLPAHQSELPQAQENSMSAIYDERLLSDAACLDPVFFDDCAAILSHGTNVNLLFVRYLPKIGADGLIVYERTVDMSMILPWTATFCRNAERFFAAAKLTNLTLEKLEQRLQ